jgi:DNA-binding FadR family transcriptional regulator
MMSVLTAEIVVGARAAGDMLPREADLAEQFEVSRGVVRECIRAMEERGLISVKHGKGATVNEPDMWDMLDSDVLAAMLDTQLGSEILSEYLECRRILEVEAAGLAAERLVETIHAALLAARYPLARPQYRVERAIPEHRRIYAAIAAHDRDGARDAMQAHLQTVASYLRDYTAQTAAPAAARSKKRQRSRTPA